MSDRNDVIVTVPPLDPTLVKTCLTAQYEVAALNWPDGEPAVRIAAEAERDLLEAAGFTSYDEGDCPRIIEDADGNPLTSGVELTTATTEHSLLSPRDIPTRWYRLGGRFWIPDVLVNFWYHYYDQRYGWFASDGARFAPDPNVTRPPMPPCAVCEQRRSEYRGRFGGIPVEFCHECNREFGHAQNLLAAELGAFDPAIAAPLMKGLGRRAGSLRTIAKRVLEVIEARRSAMPGSSAEITMGPDLLIEGFTPGPMTAAFEP